MARSGPTVALICGLLLGGGFVGAHEPTDDDTDSSSKPALQETRWAGYVGAFFVTNVSTKLSLFSTKVPLGARVDFVDDLGFDDALTVPRVEFGWRFKRNHLATFGWYDLSQTNSKVLQRDIPIGEIEFPIGIEVESKFTNEIYRAQYTWLFYNSDKVSLGFGAGLFIARLGIRITGETSLGPVAEPIGTDERLTAPLPVVGGRFGYAINRRLRFDLNSRWFLIEYGDFAGVLTDVQAVISHRSSKHVGFITGLNIQSLNAEYQDDDLTWELIDGFRGIFAGVSLYF